ncbi:hypothetical protein CPB83DRAFT_778736, partial [Crepidotus variabilis]
MCTNFIKHVLGVGTKHSGLYGKTNAYYGTVEQQGRLTLHLHLLLWIQNSPSPQEVRERIMENTEEFQRNMVEYLESVHQGELSTGSLENVQARVKESKKDKNYSDPTQTLPEAPPPICNGGRCEADCKACSKLSDWWTNFDLETDDILSRSNFHNCCLNSKGQCKARFPRDIFMTSLVEPLTGALRLKKVEQWMNTFTPALSYVMRCNTDVTSLLSGTAIKAVVAYVTDYVTKPGLTTYSIFDSVRQVFSK